jgi:4-amino-4-deoxy-L-arabinose transferase-like glycosyltransferase
LSIPARHSPPTGQFGRTDVVLALVVGAAVAVAGLLLLTPYHHWGDDFAGYLLQAHAIAHGNVRGEMHLNGLLLAASDGGIGPSAYPWGFPLLLWLTAQVGGWGPAALKLVGVCSLGAAAGLGYALARSFLGRAPSLVATAVVVLQPAVLRSADHLESDMPFLALSIAALLVCDRVLRATAEGDRTTIGWTAAAAALTACAATVRSNGALLAIAFLATVGWMWLAEPRLRRRLAISGVVYAALLAALLKAWYHWFPDGNVSMAAGGVRQHVPILFTVARRARETLASSGDIVPFSFLSTHSAAGKVVAGAVLLAVAALVPAGTWTRRPRSFPLALFALGNIGVLLIYALDTDERYLWPLILPAAVLALAGLRDLATAIGARTGRDRLAAALPAAGRWAAAAAVLALAATGWARRHEPMDPSRSGPYTAETQTMVDFVAWNVPAGARVSFFKPRALRLLTGREAIRVDQPEHVERAAFFVVDKNHDDSRWQKHFQLERGFFEADTAPRFARVFENGQFVIFERSPAAEAPAAPTTGRSGR